MQVLQKETRFDFLRWRYAAGAISVLLFASTIFYWVQLGDKKFGVDFRGGNEFVVKFLEDTGIDDLRGALTKVGLNEAIVQRFENESNEYSVRLSAEDEKGTSQKMREILTGMGKKFEVIKEDFVGPVIGEQIRRDALVATAISLIAILLYVMARFNLAFAIGAVVALLHDAVLATGATMLSGVQIGGGTLAAILTIVGYSVNDTIIIYDRVRENLTHQAKTGSAAKKGTAGAVAGLSLAELMNLSINQTLSRTVITSLTVFFVVLTLWLFGGGAVSEFAFTLLIGVLVGTYSTVFIACPVVLACQKADKK